MTIKTLPDKLVVIYIACIAMVELMGIKTFPLATIGNFHLNASVAIFLVPILYTITDVVVEVCGKQQARRLVRMGFGVIAAFFIFALLATHLPPSTRFASKEAAYDVIFGGAIRIAAASLIAFAASELLDVYIFSKIREALGKQALWLRNNLSNFIGMFVDTVLFMTLAFYALDKTFASNADFLIGLILPYWLLKCALSVVETPLVYLGVAWLRRRNEKASAKEAAA